MYKLVDIDSEFFHEEPVVKILNFDEKNHLVKVAADSRISEYASSIKPEQGKIYVHILAMGAGEYFGANRNGDYFPEENLKQFHQTFHTSPAHIFKHHVNKDPTIAIGQVVFSVYNDRMHRVEVIAWIDKQRGRDVVERIEKGEFPATSMACHTPFDTCSICGNRARSRNEYCSHLRNELGKIHSDGSKTMAINDGPLKFFDMSIVFRPADVTSSVLQKVASQNLYPVLSSAEAAQLMGLQEKTAAIKKLSELIKEVEGQVSGYDLSLGKLLDRVQDPNDKILGVLEAFELHNVIHALAELGISPSVGFFAKLIGQKLTGESAEGIEHLVEGLLKEEPHHVKVAALDEEPGLNYFEINTIKKDLLPFVKSSSLFPDQILGRTLSDEPGYEPGSFGAPVGIHSNIGYVGNGPNVEVDPRASYRNLKQTMSDSRPGLLHTLFIIGGAAVAAKWLISRLIEDKLREHREELRQAPNSPVKIVLVKTAQDTNTALQLSRLSLLKSIKS